MRHIRRVLLAVMVAIILCLLCGVAWLWEPMLRPDRTWDQHPAWSPDGQQIAFECLQTRTLRERLSEIDLRLHDAPRHPVLQPQICIMDADGKHRRQLTHDDFSNRTPVWSPDGRLILFTSDRAGNFGIYSMMPDGSQQAQVVENGHHPVWSPDGQKLAFEGPSGKVYLVDLASGASRQLTNKEIDSLGRSRPLSWSPDGCCVAFFLAFNSLHIIHIEQGYETKIAEDVLSYDWSPNGQRIAFTQFDADGIYLVDLDGSNLERLLNNRRITVHAWSPDGMHIAIKTIQGIYLVDLTCLAAPLTCAEDMVPLTDIGTFIRSPVWSPDGQYILLERLEDGREWEPRHRYTIWVMNRDGTDIRKLTP